MAATLPQDSLVYYGWPSLVNAAASPAAAATEFAQYDQVVLGEVAGRVGGAFTHPNHTDNVTTLTDPAVAGVEFYGYIACGQLAGGAPTYASVSAQVDDWVAYAALGIPIVGILLDEFGYDFGLRREQAGNTPSQNNFIDLVHTAGLKVIANGFEPRDVISPEIVNLTVTNAAGQQVVSGNSGGAATHLAATDYWMAESFVVRMDGQTMPGGTSANFDTMAEWKRRMDAYYQYKVATPVQCFALSTLPNTSPYTAFQQDWFDMCWYGATAYEVETYAYGEAEFNAGSSVNVPFRTRPTPAATIGNFITVDTTDTPLIANTLSQTVRLADNGYIIVDFGTRTADFTT